MPVRRDQGGGRHGETGYPGNIVRFDPEGRRPDRFLVASDILNKLVFEGSCFSYRRRARARRSLWDRWTRGRCLSGSQICE
jgi:hypothetical protein